MLILTSQRYIGVCSDNSENKQLNNHWNEIKINCMKKHLKKKKPQSSKSAERCPSFYSSLYRDVHVHSHPDTFSVMFYIHKTFEPRWTYIQRYTRPHIRGTRMPASHTGPNLLSDWLFPLKTLQTTALLETIRAACCIEDIQVYDVTPVSLYIQCLECLGHDVMWSKRLCASALLDVLCIVFNSLSWGVNQGQIPLVY